MQKRKDELVNGSVYHIYTRSIAGYKIFNNKSDFIRMRRNFNLCRFSNFSMALSVYDRLSLENQTVMIARLIETNDVLVEIIAFCIMPTHIHLILKQVKDGGISKFMSKVLNGYSKYFNTKYKRSGPLWSGRFKNVLVEDDEQLLHLTRYIHLNPVSARIIDKPEEWEYSSYLEYIGEKTKYVPFISREGYFDITTDKYKEFCEDRIDYQRELSMIKSLTIEDYSG